ncbi:hypothetical protein BOX15_Mlig032596g1, partial [Macrostomum lignano]
KDVETDVTAATGNPVILKEGPSTGLVDGQNLLGPVVGKFAMQLAIDKAKQSGVGWVVANNSNHFGIAGWYAMEASSEGLLGMAFTNASPLLVPTRAVNPALGTNPISLAAPNGQEPFVLDMATSAVALGKVEIQHRRGEPLPPGWALDAQGRGTTDAAVGMQGRLFPLGGPEETSGYKGYGLACLVEIFCGLLSDANWGQHIRKWKTHERKANLGQCFIAINPSMFADGFENRMSQFVHDFRSMQPSDPDKPVLIAGDPERAHMSRCEQLGGVPYHDRQLEHLNDVAKQLDVDPLKCV